MQQHLSLRRSRPRGFTIVELLIVIVIIAVLAAITIVAFNGIQARARASAVSAALNQASKKLELYSIDNGGYPAALADAGVTNANDITYQYTAGTAPSVTYCTTATQGTTSYYISDTTKTPTQGGCPGHGQGGVAAITNLVVNPSFEVGIAGWNLNTPAFTGTGSVTNLSSGYSGGRLYRYTVSAGGSLSGFGIYTQVLNLSSTQSYTLSIYIRSSASVIYRVGAERRNSSGTNIGAIYSDTVTINSNWQRVSLVVPPTTNMDRLTMVVYAPSGSLSSGDTIDFDAAMAIEGSSLYGYADGSSTNWVWNGAANASTSTGPVQ